MRIYISLIFPSSKKVLISSEIDINNTLLFYFDKMHSKIFSIEEFKDSDFDESDIEFFYDDKLIDPQQEIKTWFTINDREIVNNINISVGIADNNRKCVIESKAEVERFKNEKKNIKDSDDGVYLNLPIDLKLMMNNRVNLEDGCIKIIKRQISSELEKYINECVLKGVHVLYLKGPMGVGKSNSLVQIVSSLRKNPTNRVIYFGSSGDLVKNGLSDLKLFILNICFCFSVMDDDFANNYWYRRPINFNNIISFLEEIYNYCNKHSYTFYFIIDQYNEFTTDIKYKFPCSIVEDFLSKNNKKCNKGIVIISSSSNLDPPVLKSISVYKTFKFNQNYNETEFQEWVKLKHLDGVLSIENKQRLKECTSYNPLELSLFSSTIRIGKKSISDDDIDKFIADRISFISLNISSFRNKLSKPDIYAFLNSIGLLRLDIPVPKISQLPHYIINDQTMFLDDNSCIKTISSLHFQVLSSVWYDALKEFTSMDTFFSNVFKNQTALTKDALGRVVEKYILEMIIKSNLISLPKLHNLGESIDKERKINSTSKLEVNDLKITPIKGSNFASLKNVDFSVNRLFVPLTSNFKAVDFLVWNYITKTMWCFQVTIGDKHSNKWNEHNNANEFAIKQYSGATEVNFVWLASSKLNLADSNFRYQFIHYLEDLKVGSMFPLFSFLELA